MLSRAMVKIFKVVLKAVPEQLNLREISRRADISTETAHRLLKQLVNDNLLFVKEQGKEKIFNLNFGNALLSKYYGLIKGSEAKEMYQRVGNLTDICNRIDLALREQVNDYSLLLLSADPLKLIVLVDDGHYDQLIDHIQSLKDQLNVPLVLMSETSLKGSLDKYPDMAEVIKNTMPLKGSEKFLDILFKFWEVQHERTGSEGTGADAASDRQTPARGS